MTKSDTTSDQDQKINSDIAVSSKSKLFPRIAKGEAMSQDTGSSASLPTAYRLKGEENYAQWKFDIENIARVHGLRKYYHPKSPAPPKVVDEFDDDASAEDIKAYDEWARGDAKMKLIIRTNVSTSFASQLNRLSTAKEMWDAIANLYESSGIVLNQNAIENYIQINCA
ncbi:hypothetical protein K3495_g14279, partial [Podosphaera aphanis]